MCLPDAPKPDETGAEQTPKPRILLSRKQLDDVLGLEITRPSGRGRGVAGEAGGASAFNNGASSAGLNIVRP